MTNISRYPVASLSCHQSITTSRAGQNPSRSIRIFRFFSSYIVGTAPGVPILVADLVLQQDIALAMAAVLVGVTQTSPTGISHVRPGHAEELYVGKKQQRDTAKQGVVVRLMWEGVGPRSWCEKISYLEVHFKPKATEENGCAHPHNDAVANHISDCTRNPGLHERQERGVFDVVEGRPLEKYRFIRRQCLFHVMGFTQGEVRGMDCTRPSQRALGSCRRFAGSRARWNGTLLQDENPVVPLARERSVPLFLGNTKGPRSTCFFYSNL